METSLLNFCVDMRAFLARLASLIGVSKQVCGGSKVKGVGNEYFWNYTMEINFLSYLLHT